MKAEYDFSRAKRGKFARRVPPDAIFVRFDSRVSALFDAQGDFAARLRAVSAAGKARNHARAVALTPKEFATLRPLLGQLGGTVLGDPTTSRRRKAN